MLLKRICINKGQSTILMVLTVSFSSLVLLNSQLLKNYEEIKESKKMIARESHHSYVSDIITQVELNLKDDDAWAKIKSIANNPSYGCFHTLPCTAGESADINVYNKNGDLIINAGASEGFSLSHSSCDTWVINSNATDCYFKVVVTATSFCPDVVSPCNNPKFEIVAQLQVTEEFANDLIFNSNKHKVVVVR